MAADVNKSNSISTIDATIINQSLLGNPAALLQFKTSWRFVPQSHTMIDPPWGFPESISLPGVMASQTDQDFYGIKTGDVVATWANPANFGAGNPLVLTVQDQTLQTGAVATVGFKAGQLDDIAAFQLVLKFDPDKLALAEIIPQTGLPLTVDNFGTYNLSRGDIRIVWAQAKGVLIEEATLVFALKFNVLQSGGKLSEVISIDETELPALAYNSALAESKAELRFSETTAVGDLNGANGLQLLQNRPNPFNGTTTIGFVLPESGEAQLRVFDAAGRLLAERKGQYPAGRSEETVDLSGASGVLWYELTTPFGVLTRKMATARE
ncbi:MAG: T9SS type A sorting domain-containing protein [Saprospirales bacterium]|nr:T9SS type A sorting domain-containing protein [Saprospirales bacterium]